MFLMIDDDGILFLNVLHIFSINVNSIKINWVQLFIHFKKKEQRSSSNKNLNVSTTVQQSQISYFMNIYFFNLYYKHNM
jgi:hypothetical protein